MATRPVVVAVDGSEESLLAVEWAALEAKRYGAPLRIVSAPALPPRMRAYDTASQTVANALRSVSFHAVGAALTRSREVASGLVVDGDLLTGRPALAVTDSGAGALMLVVGARGAGGFASLLLGSVSRYAALHASCPVVVVREDTTAVHREIAVGIRDPRDIEEPLEFAFEEAVKRGATLVAVHSWYWFPSALAASMVREATRHPADLAEISADASRSLTEALRIWQEKYPAVPVRQDVVRGHPAKVLASYSAQTDLVVIGRHGGPGVGPAVGAIQHAVLNHAHGPIAIIPARH
jgi:nucleotide-binding universal stress UspA family protein